MLSGFSNLTVWLVFTAFLFSRAVTATGFGTRVGYMFVGRFGRTPLSLGLLDRRGGPGARALHSLRYGARRRRRVPDHAQRRGGLRLRARPDGAAASARS